MLSNVDLKIVFLGFSSVGKTSLIQRFCQGVFKPGGLATIGAGFLAHTIRTTTQEITLLLWDTAGEERFRSVAPCLLHGADGMVLVYDTSNSDSFKEIDIYYDMFINVVGKKKNSPLPILLFGNKSDLGVNSVSDDEIGQWVDSKNIMFSAIGSAKSGENVKNEIEKFVKAIVDSKSPSLTIPMSLDDIVPKKRPCC